MLTRDVVDLVALNLLLGVAREILLTRMEDNSRVVLVKLQVVEVDTMVVEEEKHRQVLVLMMVQVVVDQVILDRHF